MLETCLELIDRVLILQRGYLHIPELPWQQVELLDLRDHFTVFFRPLRQLLPIVLQISDLPPHLANISLRRRLAKDVCLDVTEDFDDVLDADRLLRL